MGCEVSGPLHERSPRFLFTLYQGAVAPAILPTAIGAIVLLVLHLITFLFHNLHYEISRLL